MKNYIFKKQGIVVKAKSERQAREIYNQYLHDSSDLGVAEFLKSKGIKFSKIDGTKGNIVIKFDNEKDWALGSKYLRTKYGKKGYESIKEGDKYQVILGDELVKDDTSTIDWSGDMRELDRIVKRYNISYKIIRKSGPGGGWPEIEFKGTRANLEKFLIKEYTGGDKDVDFLFDSFTIDIKVSDYADYAWKIENGDLAREVFHNLLRDGKTFEEAKKQHENICRVIESQMVKKVEKSKNIFNSMKKEYEEMYNKHHSKK